MGRNIKTLYNFEPQTTAKAIRLKADVLATADIAFQKISEIKIATPSDLTI